jgi:hypothetical protein
MPDRMNLLPQGMNVQLLPPSVQQQMNLLNRQSQQRGPHHKGYADWYGAGGVSGMLGMKPWDELPPEEIAGGFVGSITPKVGGALKGLTSKSPKLETTGPVPGVAIGDEMIGMHNLTADNLTHADKIGGLSVPSIAVTKTSNPIQGFGDVSLLPKMDLLKPSRKNPIFASDAYTPRYPDVTTFYGKADKQKIDEFLMEPWGGGPPWKSLKDAKGEHFAYGGDLDGEMAKGLSGMYSSSLMKTRFLHDMGIRPEVGKDAYAYTKKVREIIDENQPAYQNWLNNLDDSLGLTPNERIFKGYTDAGNKRYAPHTLENVVKEMKGSPAGREGMNYGLGSLRAEVTPKFRTVSDMKAKRENLVSKEAMETAKDELNQEFFALAAKLDNGGSVGYDVVQARLAEIPKYGTRNTLKEYYEDISDGLVDEVDGFLKKLANSPTEYFEGKPQRAVSIDEMAGALIKKDSPASVEKILKKNGVERIEKYTDDADKIKQLRKFRHLMFSAGGAALGPSIVNSLQGEMDLLK